MCAFARLMGRELECLSNYVEFESNWTKGRANGKIGQMFDQYYHIQHWLPSSASATNVS